ncbi:hypothetical protein [Eubacterium sp.]|uniref:hypothetical protein n=1 Tax=Eubacterium sp. TaxID=142586 RepID=UPI002FC84DC7
MNRGIHRKVTFKDWFAYRYYPKGSKRRIVRDEKRENHRAIRRGEKREIEERLKNEDEQIKTMSVLWG